MSLTDSSEASNVTSPTRSGELTTDHGTAPSNSSGRSFRGLSWDKKFQGWRARIYFCGKQRHIGRYTNHLTAAKAYDKAAVYLYGETAITNFGLEACQQDPAEDSPYIVTAKRIADEQARQLAGSIEQLQLQPHPQPTGQGLQLQDGSHWTGLPTATTGRPVQQWNTYTVSQQLQQQQQQEYILAIPSGSSSNSSSNASMTTSMQYPCPLSRPRQQHQQQQPSWHPSPHFSTVQQQQQQQALIMQQQQQLQHPPGVLQYYDLQQQQLDGAPIYVLQHGAPQGDMPVQVLQAQPPLAVSCAQLMHNGMLPQNGLLQEAMGSGAACTSPGGVQPDSGTYLQQQQQWAWQQQQQQPPPQQLLNPQYAAAQSALAAQQLQQLQGGAMLSASGSPVAAAGLAAAVGSGAVWTNSPPPLSQLSQLSLSVSAAAAGAGGLALGSVPLCMVEGGGGGGCMMAGSACAPMQQISSRVVLQEGYPAVVATAAMSAAAGHVGRFL